MVQRAGSESQPVRFSKECKLEQHGRRVHATSCHETMPFDPGEEFDATEWASMNAQMEMFFASYVNSADNNSATQLVNAAQAWL